MQHEMSGLAQKYWHTLYVFMVVLAIVVTRASGGNRDDANRPITNEFAGQLSDAERQSSAFLDFLSR